MAPRILDFDAAARGRRRAWERADGREATGVQAAPEEVVAPSHGGRRTLANVRMALTLASEGYYLGKNYTDHVVRLTERLLFGEKYLPDRLRHYRGQRKVAMLYHGYLQGRAAFERLERLLESEVFNIFGISGGYQPYSQDIRRSAEYERRVLDFVLRETDVQELYLIGHSQGGLVVRTVAQRLDPPASLKKCICLATPHMGTWAAVAGAVNRVVTRAAGLLPNLPAVEGESAFQMLPGSPFLAELNRTPLPGGVDFLNLYNKLDPLVWPSRYARLPYSEATNVLLKKVGHMQPLYDYQELDIMLRALLTSAGDRQRSFAQGVLAGQEVLERRVMGSGPDQYAEYVTSSD